MPVEAVAGSRVFAGSINQSGAIEVRADRGRARSADLARQVGDAGRAKRDVGWTPKIDLAVSLSDVLDEWRQREGIAKESPL